jgi:DNA processing protein
MLSETHYWLGLSLVPTLGTTRIQHLIDHFGTAEKVWQASKADLALTNLTTTSVEQFLKFRQATNLNKEFDKVIQCGASLITMADETYPLLLRKIASAPPILYVRGNLLERDMLALAVVGTRKASIYGRDATLKLCRELAQNGVTIISGLAQGIDSHAHRGAINGGGRTIVVLGSGIDYIYPTQNKDLAKEILQNNQGAIISEFPIGMKAHPMNFPRRNRIISGLSLGVLITEAPEKSGALITAEYAIEQGREIFAIPASIFSTNSLGTNRLIQDGAKMVLRADDILSELNIQKDRTVVQHTAETITIESDDEKTLFELLNYEGIHVDDLIRTTQMRPEQVISALTMLELKGLAQMVGYMHYCRSHDS